MTLPLNSLTAPHGVRAYRRATGNYMSTEPSDAPPGNYMSAEPSDAVPGNYMSTDTSSNKVGSYTDAERNQ
jgi:hypothetical protein